MYHFIYPLYPAIIILAFTLAAPVIAADGNKSQSEDTNIAQPVMESGIDFFEDDNGKDDIAIEPINENVEEADVIDQRPKAEKQVPSIDPDEPDDDKYKKARMAFLFGQYERAYRVWKPLADKGHAKSQATIGWMYHTGKGVDKDLSQAREWYKKAANQNHAIALNNLGVFYEQGKSVHKSLTEAAHYYTESAEWGYSYAQYNLGILYEKGKGVEKDINLAIYWLQLAALQGVKQAQEELNRLSKSKKPSHPSTKIISMDELNKNSDEDANEPAWARVKHGKADTSDSSASGDKHKKLYQKLYHKKRAPTPPTPAKGKSNTLSSDKGEDDTKNKAGKKATNPGNDTGKLINKAKTDSGKKQAPTGKADDKQTNNTSASPPAKDKHAKPDINVIADEAWIQQQNPKHFTLQIAGSNDLKKLLTLARSSPIARKLAYFQTTRKGRAWYSLVYGSFSKKSEALEQVEKLPEDFKQWSPWLRKIANVQASITSHAKSD